MMSLNKIFLQQGHYACGVLANSYTGCFISIQHQPASRSHRAATINVSTSKPPTTTTTTTAFTSVLPTHCCGHTNKVVNGVTELCGLWSKNIHTQHGISSSRALLHANELWHQDSHISTEQDMCHMTVWHTSFYVTQHLLVTSLLQHE